MLFLIELDGLPTYVMFWLCLVHVFRDVGCVNGDDVGIGRKMRGSVVF